MERVGLKTPNFLARYLSFLTVWRIVSESELTILNSEGTDIMGVYVVVVAVPLVHFTFILQSDGEALVLILPLPVVVDPYGVVTVF